MHSPDIPHDTTTRWRRVALAVLLGAVPLLLFAPPALAGHHERAEARASEMSLDEAADRVQGAYGGRVIAASAAQSGGHAGYRIRVMLDDGRVITVFVDAETGAMRPM